MRDDADLQRDVLDELKWSPAVNASDVGVTVSDGVVTLAGFVSSYPEKWLAERAAKRVAGVRALAVKLEVKVPGATQRTDSDIALAAERALEWNVSVPRDRIKVTVEKGFLTLEGEVDWEHQRTAAKRSVHHLTGVTGVANEITLKPRVMTTEVKTQIEAAFERNAILDAKRIRVQTDGSKVILSGNVRSWDERDEAETAAWAAPGVEEVENRILISN